MNSEAINKARAEKVKEVQEGEEDDEDGEENDSELPRRFGDRVSSSNDVRHITLHLSSVILGSLSRLFSNISSLSLFLNIS